MKIGLVRYELLPHSYITGECRRTVHKMEMKDFLHSCIIDEYWKSDQKTSPKMEMLKDLLTEYLEYSGVWCYADIS